MKKMLKVIFSLSLTAAMVVSLGACSSNDAAQSSTSSTTVTTSSSNSDEKIKIGIVQQQSHAALDSSREGFLAAIAEGGYVDGENIEIDLQNAQGDQSNLKTISQRFVQNENDLILAIATPAAQSIATETSEIPVLATAVTDYVEAGLVTLNEEPGGNVSGTSDLTPVKQQFDLMTKILPDAKTIGIMYNSSEVNSEIQAKLAEQACKDLNLGYEFGTVTSTNDIAQAVQSISTKVDVIYIPTDNTFASAIATVCNIATEAGIPAIVGESALVEGGGLATVGIDYYKLGVQTGKMAIRVLEGEDISKMPVEFTDNADISINIDTAKALNITIPDDIISNAKIIVENGEVVKK